MHAAELHVTYLLFFIDTCLVHVQIDCKAIVQVGCRSMV
jgi:hypothetical protein